MSEIAAAFESVTRQDNAVLDKAFAEFYPELKRIARSRLRGTGLQGLRERVEGLGGDLRVLSPPGGPTTISVELPCAS